MNEKPLFQENQKFTQWWVWAIIIGANLIGGYSLLKEFENNKLSLLFLNLYFLFFGIFILFFYFLKLETIITKDYISIRFFPFHWKERKYFFSEISQMEVIKYSPIFDYGGWGIRYGRNGKAFNVAGNMGLELHFLNRKNLLIGTQKPEELKKVLETIIK